MKGSGVEVVVADDAYGEAAALFSQKLLDRLVAALARNRLIALAEDEGVVNVIYDLAFALFVAIEDHQGSGPGGTGPVAHLAFADRHVEPERLLVSWRRTFLHGGLDDAMILQAIAAARGQVEEPAGRSSS